MALQTLAMVKRRHPMESLTHLVVPKRFWVDGTAPYREADYEEEIRAVLASCARTSRVLEVNTTRGVTLCPDITVVRWWHEAGGKAVQYGSDAHQPDKVGEGFAAATKMVEAAGFKPAAGPTALLRR